VKQEMDRVIVRSFISKNRSVFIILGFVLAIFSLAIIFQKSFGENVIRISKNKVQIATVLRGKMSDDMLLRAEALPNDLVVIGATEGGTVESVLVQPGDAVTYGQPLVILNNTQLELQVLEQEARLIESITQLQAYQNSLEQNRLNNDIALSEIDYNIKRLSRSWERISVLATQNMVSKEQADQLLYELESFKVKRPIQVKGNEKMAKLSTIQLPQLANQISMLQQNLKITHSKLDYLKVKSSFSGLVTSMDLKVGQTLSQGDRLMQIALATGFKLSQAVDQFYLSRLKVGQFGTVSINNGMSAVQVVRIYPEIKNGVFMIDLNFVGETPKNLLSGMIIQGKLSLGNSIDTTYMPLGPYLEHTAGRWLLVLTSDGKGAKRTPIIVGLRNSEQIEVLKGVRPGENFIVSDYAGFENVESIQFE
jgi:HlyD family secretion protein